MPLVNDTYLLSEDFLSKLNFSKKSKTPSTKSKPKGPIIKKKTSSSMSVSISPESSGGVTSASPSSGLTSNSRNKSPKTKS